MRNVFITDDDIILGQEVGAGSNGSTHIAYYDDEKVAVKMYWNSNIMTPELSSKLITLASDSNEFSNALVVPKFIIGDEEKVNKYVSDFVFGRRMLDFSRASIEEKIKILKKVKDVIAEMHKRHNIIHGDLHMSNIMLSYGDVRIIDFDSCAYDGHELELRLTNDAVNEFVKCNGVNENIDWFMFNLITYGFLNKKGTMASREEILKGRYGVFESKEMINLCNRVANLSDNADLLIDLFEEYYLDNKDKFKNRKKPFMRILQYHK